MGYNRTTTPRAYVDVLSYHLANGFRTLDNINMKQNDNSTAVTFDAGSKANMFDMKPANFAQIASTNQAFYIQFDFGELAGSTDPTTDALSETNFLAILGHNFKTSEAMFKVELDDDVNMNSPTQVSLEFHATNAPDGYDTTKAINADNASSGSNMFIKPPKNGWTLIHWTKAIDNRFLRITFKDYGGANSNFLADVIIGSIMFGKYIDFQSPNINIDTQVIYDGTDLLQSTGGATFANSKYFGEPTWNSTLPWNLSEISNQQTYGFNRRYGRVKHSMNFDYVTDTNLFSPNWFADHDNPADWYDSNTIHSSFYNQIIGQHLPFLFSLDSASTTTGDYGLYRLVENGFTARQVAPRIWNTNLDIIESW
tara:strand:- start:754 stop:1857 length:1104 start_codon:yes stop_codon:yes gene_type:complete